MALCPICEQEADNVDEYESRSDDEVREHWITWQCFNCGYEWDIFEDVEEEDSE